MRAEVRAAWAVPRSLLPEVRVEKSRPPPSVPGGGDTVAGTVSSLQAVVRPQTLCCGRESRATAQKATRVRSTWVNGVFPP